MNNSNPEKEEEEKLVQFKVIDGGRTAREGGPTGTNWLLKLKEGDVFLAKDKDPMNFLVQQFEILVSFENAVKLFSNVGVEAEVWVHPDTFCRKFNLLRVLSNGNID